MCVDVCRWSENRNHQQNYPSRITRTTNNGSLYCRMVNAIYLVLMKFSLVKKKEKKEIRKSILLLPNPISSNAYCKSQ